MWMSEVAMKVWSPGLRAPSTALTALRMSPCCALARLSTMGRLTALHTCTTDSKSPGDDAAKPASITSTPSLSS